MSGLNCLFDASPITLLIFAELYTQAGVSRRALFLAYAIVCLALFALVCTMWFLEERTRAREAKTKAVAVPVAEGIDEQAKQQSAREVAVTSGLQTTTIAVTYGAQHTANGPDNDADAAVVVVHPDPGPSASPNTPVPAADANVVNVAVQPSVPIQTETPAQTLSSSSSSNASINPKTSGFVDPLSERPLSEQLRSYPFWFAVVFMTIQSNRSVFFIGMQLSPSVSYAFLLIFACFSFYFVFSFVWLCRHSA